MKKTKVLVIDDNVLWIKRGKRLLEPAGYEVNGLVVTDPKQFTSELLPESVAIALKGADVLLIDEDLGERISSARLICVVKHKFPTLSIIRWIGNGYGSYRDKLYMGYLGVTNIKKPNKKNEAEFIETFTKALDEQKLVFLGPMGIYTTLDEMISLHECVIELRVWRLQELRQIAELATADEVFTGRSVCPLWKITGHCSDYTRDALGHCICDGVLTVEDIKPYLTALQVVIAKFETAGKIDKRFQICAEFIKRGNLDELEMVWQCYESSPLLLASK